MRPTAGVSDPGADEPYRLLQLLAAPRRKVRRHVPLHWRRRLAVLVGGMVGGAARLALSVAFDGAAVPWGTFAANLAGALLLGYLLTRFLRAASRTTLTIPLLCTGLLGSFTTFSTFSVETVELAQRGRVGLAVGYAGGSVVLGLAAAALGIRLAERRA